MSTTTPKPATIAEAINDEQEFRRFLLTHPGDAKLRYVNGFEHERPGCIVCTYLRDHCGLYGFTVATIDVRDHARANGHITFPPFMQAVSNILGDMTDGTMNDLRRELAKHHLLPNEEPQPTA